MPHPLPPSLAGNCSVTEIESYIAAGFDAVVPKPFGGKDLRLVLEQYVVPYYESNRMYAKGGTIGTIELQP